MNSHRSCFFALAFIGSVISTFAQSTAVRQATPEFIYPGFRDVLKLAEEHSHRYEKLDLTLLNEKLRNEIAKADRRPSVNLSTGVGAYWSNFENSAGETEDIQFGLNDLRLSTFYSLYSWGSKQAGHRVSDRNFQAFLISYEQQMSDIGRELRNRYFQLILDKFSIRTLELEIAINQTNINEDTIRYEQGRLSAENYERSINSRKSRMLDLERMRRNIDRSVEDFNRVLGVDNAINLDDIPTFVPRVPNVNEDLVAMARKSISQQFADIPNIQQSKLYLENAEDYIVQSQSAKRPNIGLSAGSAINIEPTQGNQRVISFNAGLGVSWNIYSGGATTKRMLAAYNDRTAQLADFRNLLEHTRITFERMIDDLVHTYQKLEIAESEYQLALQSYEKSKEEYERGRVSELQFTHIELGRLYQERAIYEQRRQYIVSITDFLATLGKDPVLEILTRPDKKDLSSIQAGR
jgi:outer membrane protein TolC